MKTLFVVLASVVVVAQSQNQYVPVIKDGVPLDTPEVQAAKAAHFQAYARAQTLAAKKPSDGQYNFGKSQQNFAKYQTGTQYDFGKYQPKMTYQPRVEYNEVAHYEPYPPKYSFAAYSSAVPVDTPEVQQARSNHLSLFQTQHFRYRRSQHQWPQSYLVEEEPQVLNTPEVEAAAQRHHLAKDLAESGIEYSAGLSIHGPVLSPNGVPFETPEVFLARKEHEAAHAREATKEAW